MAVFASNAITVDESKCIGCSLCVRDCPNGLLYLENGKAHSRNSGCIECGHCYAICPQHAIRMNHLPDDAIPVTPVTAIDSDLLLSAMKSRRSIRQFKKDPVEPEKLQKILEAGRYCPTGSNAQNVSFTILGSRQNELEKECVDLFRKAQKVTSPFAEIVKNLNITDDFFFKGAPLVIVVSSKSEVNAGLASSYMELMAESMGLGVLYSGFFVICSKLNAKIKGMLDLPKGDKVVSCLVIGYPNVKYQRVAPRKELKVKTL